MFYSEKRDEIRQTYFDVWQKYRQQQPMLPLEQQILQVMLDHPEYHGLFEKSDTKHHDYLPELGQTNPFLHMGLHLALREQVATNRPQGITLIYQNLCRRFGSPLETEHAMMECLAEAMWLAQKNKTTPDEQHYLEQLKKL